MKGEKEYRLEIKSDKANSNFTEFTEKEFRQRIDDRLNDFYAEGSASVAGFCLGNEGFNFGINGRIAYMSWVALWPYATLWRMSRARTVEPNGN